MAKIKITPKIRQYISDNRTIASRPLANLIWTKFQVKVSHVTVQKALDEIRAEKKQENEAKVEAVREKILDDADKWANKYLRYLDEEVENLKAIADAATDTKIENARDRATVSMALQKGLSMVLDFVKPENEIKINVTQDLSKLSDEELKQLDRITAKLESQGGAGKEASS